MAALHSTFAKEWLQSPRRVGAIAPSGSGLSAAMTRGISGASGPVIELGAGTGVFTTALLKTGVKASDLAAVEMGTIFVTELRERHPAVHVIKGDAREIENLSPFPNGEAGHVVSGLPFLAMHQHCVFEVLSGSFNLLRSGGTFRCFTYGPSCPVPDWILADLGLKAARTAFVLMNLPPASVYEISRSV